MSAPDVGQINNGAGGLNGVKLLQAVQNNPALLDPVKGFAKGVAEGPAQKDTARRLHLFGVISDDGNTDGGNPCLLDNPLNQSHGLIADPSARG